MISLLVSPVVHCSYRLLVIAIISFLDTFFQSRARSTKCIFRFVSCHLYLVSCILYCVFCILHFVFCIYSDHIQSWHLSTETTLSTTDPVSRPLTLDGSFYPRKDQINFGLWTSLILGEVLSLLHFIVLKIGRIEHTEIILVRLRMIQRDFIRCVR